MSTQGWSPLGWTGWNSLQSKGLSSLLQHHSSKASILWCSAFFTDQLSHPYMTTGKTIALTRQTLVGKVMSLLLNYGIGEDSKKILHTRFCMDYSINSKLLTCCAGCSSFPSFSTLLCTLGVWFPYSASPGPYSSTSGGVLPMGDMNKRSEGERKEMVRIYSPMTALLYLNL